MKDLNFLIILAYYQRPQIVLNALESIKNLTYKNWNLDFIDDSGDTNFQSTLFEYGLDNSKVNYIPIGDSNEQKNLQGGSRHGQFINQSIQNSNSDIVIILCDDDALINGSFEYLNEYYQLNPEVNWAYSKVLFYDPSKEHYSKATKECSYSHPGSSYEILNTWNKPLNPYCKVDSSQVSFRTKVFKESHIKFPSPQTRNLDASVFKRVFNHYGYCYPTFTYGQYKAAFDDCMGNRFKSNVNNEYQINNS